MLYRKIIIYIVFLFSFITYGSSVNIAISSPPNNLNPFFSTDANSQNINRLTHISLIDFGKDMRFFCRLCKTIEETLSGKEHHLIFTLKSGIKFWDGEEVNSGHVLRSWKYFIEESNYLKSIFRISFNKIKTIEVLSDYKIRIIYKEYNLSNLSDLALLKIVKLKRTGKKINTEDIIGAGDYRFENISPLEISLKPTNDPSKPKLIFKVVKDETTLALKLIKGEVDLSIANISPRKYDWLKKNYKNELSFYKRDSTNYQYLAFNFKKKNMAKIEVRKAIKELLPIDEIIKFKLRQTVSRSHSFLSKAFIDYYDDPRIVKRNVENALNSLDKAGLVKDEYGIRFNIDWKVSNSKPAIELVHTFKNVLNKYGIIVNITIQEWGTFRKSIKSGRFDIFSGRWIGFTGPQIMNFVFHSKNHPPNGANRGYYMNKTLDKYLDKGLNAVNKKDRMVFYRKAQQIVNEELPYIHLWHPKIIWISRKCLTSLSLFPNGGFLGLASIRSNCR